MELSSITVGDVTYVEILNDDSGKPRGSAIVEFQSQDLVRKAVNKMHRFETKGRKLVIKEVGIFLMPMNFFQGKIQKQKVAHQMSENFLNIY